MVLEKKRIEEKNIAKDFYLVLGHMMGQVQL
jgi:hypothetical protein